MSDQTGSPDLGEHVAIIQPDNRRRWGLGRYATREDVDGWRVFVSKDGRTIRLEAIVHD
jgi:hypothetical protein